MVTTADAQKCQDFWHKITDYIYKKITPKSILIIISWRIKKS